MTQYAQGMELLYPVLPELLETLGSGLILTDQQGLVKYVNSTTLKLLGVGQLEHLREIPGEKVRKELLKAALDSGQEDAVSRPQVGCLQWDHHLPGAIGDKILHVRTRLVEKDQEKNRIFFFEDVTGLRHAERVLGGTQAIGFLTEDTALRDSISLVEKVANTDSCVFFWGESGSGKGLMARLLHQLSPRNSKPLIEVNCAAIPENLFEAEFFGSVKGAFTGAVSDRIGRFTAADGGTLFLDEVSELPLYHQAKLLKVLEDNCFEPLGSIKTRHVDVRVIAASNRNLKEAVESGTFRSDLYCRLNVIPVRIPPLRERPSDIILLAEHFLQSACKSSQKIFSAEAKRLLLDHPWPGNVRELRNVVEYLAICSAEVHIHKSDFPKDFQEKSTAVSMPGDKTHSSAKASYGKEQLQRLLSKHHGNRAQCARELGIDRVTLWRHLKRWGLTNGTEVRP